MARPSYQKMIRSYETADVFSAAAAAQRINGSYVRELTAETPEGTQLNRNIVYNLLADTTQITEEDRIEGAKVRQYYQGLTFKILKGITLNDFEYQALTLANCETIETSLGVGVITSLPSCYLRSIARDEAERKVRYANGGYLAAPGVKVNDVVLEVMKSVYSEKYGKYGVYFITCLTPDKQAVFFSYRERLLVGNTIKVSGRVKAHRDGSTQLSHTKVI
jgi:hypothetical protein